MRTLHIGLSGKHNRKETFSAQDNDGSEGKDERERPAVVKNGRDFNDNRSLLRDFISEEELWACTTCNACAKECPININHPTLIVDMRRYLVMEEASAPGELKAVFNNIENNGAPWQYSAEDRLNWAKDLEMAIK